MPHRVDPHVDAHDRTGRLTAAILREPQLRIVQQAPKADFCVTDAGVTVWFDGTKSRWQTVTALLVALAGGVALVWLKGNPAPTSEPSPSSFAPGVLVAGLVLVAIGAWGVHHLRSNREVITRVNVDGHQIRVSRDQGGVQQVEATDLGAVTRIRFAEIHSEYGTTYGADLLIEDELSGSSVVGLPRASGSLVVIRAISWFRPEIPIDVVAVQHLHRRNLTTRDWVAGFCATVGLCGPMVVLIAVVQMLGVD